MARAQVSRLQAISIIWDGEDKTKVCQDGKDFIKKAVELYGFGDTVMQMGADEEVTLQWSTPLIECLSLLGFFSMHIAFGSSEPDVIFQALFQGNHWLETSIKLNKIRIAHLKTGHNSADSIPCLQALIRDLRVRGNLHSHEAIFDMNTACYCLDSSIRICRKMCGGSSVELADSMMV